jgi:hypothetical protein
LLVGKRKRQKGRRLKVLHRLNAKKRRIGKSKIKASKTGTGGLPPAIFAPPLDNSALKIQKFKATMKTVAKIEMTPQRIPCAERAIEAGVGGSVL